MSSELTTKAQLGGFRARQNQTPFHAAPRKQWSPHGGEDSPMLGSVLAAKKHSRADALGSGLGSSSFCWLDAGQAILHY